MENGALIEECYGNHQKKIKCILKLVFDKICIKRVFYKKFNFFTNKFLFKKLVFFFP